MFISDRKKDQAVRIARNYAAASLFCALFGAVYEIFSHEVYSYSMIYAFIIPLAGGALPFLAIAAGHIKRFPGRISRSLYHAAIATLTIGSIMKGVLEIYGTTSVLLPAYWIAGGLLIAGAVILNIAVY
ncbi:MAG: hypothetical protein IJ198_08740 [Lachnospiraceae bacterium]|nr:hypothetical protein [Lachnospiraceae bacterium]